MMRKLITAVLAVLFPVLGFGEDGCSYDFTRFSVEEGLSNATAHDVFTDGKGIVWIGTNDGLDSYDGKAVKTYPATSGFSVNQVVGTPDGQLYLCLPNKLGMFDCGREALRTYPCGGINCLAFKDSLFVASGGNVLSFNPESGNFRKILSLGKNLEITSLAVLGDTLYLGTRQDGVYFSILGGKPEKILSAGKVADICPDGEGGVWVCTWTQGLYRIGRDGRITNWREGGPSGLSSDFVRTCCEDGSGNIFVGTIKGIDLLDPSTGRVRHVNNNDGSGRRALSSDSVWKIRRDRQGNLWVATYYGGVNLFNPGKKLFTYYTESKGSLSDRIVGRMYGDSRDNLWISTESGITYLDRKSGAFRTYAKTLEHVKALWVDEENDAVWAGADMGGLFRIDTGSGRIVAFHNDPSDPSSIPGNRVRDIIPYKGDSLIVATQSGTGIFSTSTGKCRRILEGIPGLKVVIGLTLDSRGNLWVSSGFGGLFRYSPASGETVSFGGEGGPGKKVSGTYQDSKGRIWVSTFDSGLYLYGDGSFKRYDNASCGLESNCINAVREIPSKGVLVLATGSGFSTLDPESGRTKNYNASTGLPFASSSENALHITCDGTVCLGSTQGMVSFNASDLSRNPERFDIVVSGCTIEGWPEVRSFKKGTPALVSLAATNYIKSDQVCLSYSVDGKIFPVSAGGTIDLGGLSLGRHCIKVFAEDVPDEICPPLEFKVKVEIKTSTLVYILIVLILIAALVSLAVLKSPSASAAVSDNIPEEAAAPQTKEEIMLEKAKKAVEKHLDDCNFGVPEFCTEMGMSRTVLFQKIKEISDKTPNDFITDIRLAKAAELLERDTDLSIADIAEKTGFRSSAYFSQKFKDTYGAAPLSWRKSRKA